MAQYEEIPGIRMASAMCGDRASALLY